MILFDQIEPRETNNNSLREIQYFWPYRTWLHNVADLVVQAKGKSELHELRKVIGSEAKLPAVERSKSGRNATWTLPDGGGLVAVPSGATLKETKERLARATRE